MVPRYWGESHTSVLLPLGLLKVTSLNRETRTSPHRMTRLVFPNWDAAAP